MSAKLVIPLVSVKQPCTEYQHNHGADWEFLKAAGGKLHQPPD